MTVWFDTRDLRRDDTDVWVLAGAQQVIAKRVWVRRRGEFVATWRAKVVSRQGAYGEPTRFRYKDLLSRVTITRWRPVDPSRFPDPLPKPARIEGDAPWQSKAEPVIPPESVDEFEWPGPYNLPPNIIAREAQVRIVRGLRTERVLRDSKGHHGPSGFVGSLAIATMRINGEFELDHFDGSYVPAGTPWQPTRTDVGDWDIALGWYVQLRKIRCHDNT